MKDYGMLFEQTVNKFWGAPKTITNYANYYGDNFSMRAILFSIAIQEINYNAEKYKPEQLSVFKDYEFKANKETTTHQDNIEFLEFLSEL